MPRGPGAVWTHWGWRVLWNLSAHSFTTTYTKTSSTKPGLVHKKTIMYVLAPYTNSQLGGVKTDIVYHNFKISGWFSYVTKAADRLRLTTYRLCDELRCKIWPRPKLSQISLTKAATNLLAKSVTDRLASNYESRGDSSAFRGFQRWGRVRGDLFRSARRPRPPKLPSPAHWRSPRLGAWRAPGFITYRTTQAYRT